ncbi:MAG: heavy metal translocating P-type ATPase, partial [bacterium]
MQELKLEIPILLPGVEDERDQSVERLLERVKSHRGIAQAHVDRKNGQACFCLHYDPNLVSLQQVQRWAEQAGAEVRERYKHESFRITDMDCGNCATSIEHILGRLNGMLNVSVNYAAEKMRAEYDASILHRAKIVQRVSALGYKVEEEERPNWFRQNWELVLALLSGFFLAVGFFGEKFFGLPRNAALASYILAYLTGGYDATRHGFKAALHFRFDIDFLMVVAAIGAAILGEWAEGALLLFLFSLGHSLEHYAMGKARNAIKALGAITPKIARVRRNGREVEIPVEQLLRGDLVFVRPGERIPIDGKITEGNSTVDQSPITGESVPVAASPCALAIATPAAILSGVAQAARNGVLVKGGVHLENLGRLDAMALDKTGTITSGKFAVTDIVTLNNTSEDELLRLAAAVETRS